MNKKITMLVFNLNHGGAEKVCLTLSNEFVKRDYDVELWIAETTETSLTKKLDENITVLSFNKNHVRNCVIPMAKLLISRKPKQLLVFHIELALLAIVLKKILFLKTSIVVRSINTLSQAFTYPKNVWEKYFAKVVIKQLLLYSDKIIAQSTGMKKDLIDKFKIHPDKLVTIHNPAFVFSINGTGMENHASDNDIEFLYVGRLSPQKGLNNLIQAFNQAYKQNQNLSLKLVGEGPEKEKLQKLVNELNLSGSIGFEGFQSHTKKYYSRAKATLLTSNFEGFPNVLIESISLGTPVISFDCPSGPDDIIEPGINGILVPHLNVEKFAEAMLDVANEKVKFDSQKIINSSKRFSMDSIVNQYENLLFNN